MHWKLFEVFVSVPCFGRTTFASKRGSAATAEERSGGGREIWAKFKSREKRRSIEKGRRKEEGNSAQKRADDRSWDKVAQKGEAEQTEK